MPTHNLTHYALVLDAGGNWIYLATRPTATNPRGHLAGKVNEDGTVKFERSTLTADDVALVQLLASDYAAGQQWLLLSNPDSINAVWSPLPATREWYVPHKPHAENA